ncbi:DUF3310 domain-containing protein (plasmid) [Fructilactobacillus ixorae]|uniref:DUF3310 domain-containing protein n=1 Tax=Fructilactobacillus ixorae TaxID=1750535 RepID=A0ABY5C6D2_9LACO|nr:DUF3310 domain-containing protein [Fructilactobacillus ixorae]USS93986.1 DUF3310 domain-containing protein [Fructilactobacillus ixorae]
MQPQNRYKHGKYDLIHHLSDIFPRNWFIGFMAGNVIKYVVRFEDKGTPVQDLEKAKDYLERLIDWRKAENND